MLLSKVYIDESRYWRGFPSFLSDLEVRRNRRPASLNGRIQPKQRGKGLGIADRTVLGHLEGVRQRKETCVDALVVLGLSLSCGETGSQEYFHRLIQNSRAHIEPESSLPCFCGQAGFFQQLSLRSSGRRFAPI